MNKASGKLAAGVRKLKTQQKTAAAVDPKVTPPADAPKRPAAVSRVNGSTLHPARVWPD